MNGFSLGQKVYVMERDELMPGAVVKIIMTQEETLYAVSTPTNRITRPEHSVYASPEAYCEKILKDFNCNAAVVGTGIEQQEVDSAN